MTNRLSEAEAYRLFMLLKWPSTDGKPVCPRCGHGESYKTAARSRYSCKACTDDFTVRSGTIFENGKMPYAAMVSVIDALCLSKSLPSTKDVAERAGLSRKGSYVFRCKVLEIIASLPPDQVLSRDAIIAAGLRMPPSALAGYYQRSKTKGSTESAAPRS